MSEIVIITALVCTAVVLSVFFGVGFWAVVQFKKMEKKDDDSVR